MKIILGSSSEGRRKVMEREGYNFTIIKPEIDEKKIRYENPKDLVKNIANAKMDALLPKIKEEAIVITSDQVILFQGKIREKPENNDEAYEFLKSYGKEPVETLGSIVVVNTKNNKREVDIQNTRIYFKPFSDELIKKHIGNGSAFKGAGGFVIEEIKEYIQRIEGSMESAMGLDKDLLKKMIEMVK